MHKTSEKTDQLFPAIFAARKQFVKVVKDAQNNHLKNKYATLDAVLDTVTPALEDKDVMIEQSMEDGTTVDALRVVTTLRHISGQFISYLTVMPVGKKDAQGVGSAFTYARRYALAACFGLSQADDDAELSVVKASDWNKRLSKCSSKQELMDMLQNAWPRLSSVDKPIIQAHYEKLKADFEAKELKEKGGFTPATKKDRVSVKSDVESKPNQSVESEPKTDEDKAKAISSFE